MTDFDPIEEFSLNDPTDYEPDAPPYEPNPTTESVLIDWQRVSAFKKVLAVVDVLEPVVADFEGVSPKRKEVRKHLRLAALNLVVAWRLWKWLSYPADNNKYADTHGRYNLLRITKQFPIIMRALEAAGYVEIKTGFRDEVTGKGFQTRAKATDKLLDLIAPIQPHMVQTPKFRESVLLYEDGVDEYGKPKGRRQAEYTDAPEIRRMRMNLFAYNSLIHRTKIDFDLPLPNGENVDFQKWFTYRSFNKGTFDAGGRFYGPWWVTLPSIHNSDGTKFNTRQFIFINGNAVVE